MKTIPVQRVRETLYYEHETGILCWKPRLSGSRGDNIFNAKFANERAFTARNAYGHHHGIIDGVRLYAHRVIWAHVTGSWPDRLVDHINGDPSDNRWRNLRLATVAENNRNRSPRLGGTSPYIGVSLRPNGRWQAALSKQYLGVFDDPVDAAAAYDRAAKAAFGRFARLNFPTDTAGATP